MSSSFLLALISAVALSVLVLLARARRALGTTRRTNVVLRAENARLSAENTRLRSDTVTGLLLRKPWTDAASAVLPFLSQPAVLFVDVNKLKPLNDTISHRAGDRLLREIADRLRAQLGEKALLGRIGGDEFVALLDLDAIGNWQTTLRSTVTACQVEVAGKVCGAAFGLARPIDLARRVDATSTPTREAVRAASGRLDRLMHAADLAMNRAKQRCRSENLVVALELYGSADPVVPLTFDPDPSDRARDDSHGAGIAHTHP
ncbi:GGDEF domain-containing protein [Amycolatopsis sp. cmx-4-54]|uniref:GGDEF domain-containing protein n=1 Tax=Amycolatopsis sp. cmx-4-54 TaxID=2790936 RepID=UPI003978A0CF